VGDAADGEEALEKIAERRPDVVTLDIFMPKMKGDEILRAIRQRDLDVKVLILTSRPVAGLYDVLQERPDSLLFKHEPARRICDEVVALAEGIEYSYGKLVQRQAAALAFARVKLTSREQSVLELIGEGLRVHEIATQMSVSKTLVNSLLHSVRAKLEVSSNPAAIATAHEIGLLKATWL